ncbi:MAG: hypothetical protein AMXMBFR13_19980 [Phycisphaerae bacterium]
MDLAGFRLRLLLVSLLLSGPSTGVASAAKYLQVLSINEMNRNQPHLNWHKFTVVDGTTTYHHVCQLKDAARDLEINKTIDTGGSPVTSNLVTLASWTEDIGAPNLGRVGPALGVEIVGDYIQFPDNLMNQVVRIHKVTGEVSVYVSKADIMAVTGTPDLTVTKWSGMSPEGESVFYEEDSNSILQTNGPGAVVTVVSSAELTAAGVYMVESGLTYDGAGNLYWGDDTGDNNTVPVGDRIFRRAPDGTITSIINAHNFQDLGISVDRAIFTGDMYYAPDGLIYFRYGKNTSGSLGIYCFNPASPDPASTLAIVLSEADFLAGPSGAISQWAGATYHMSWWDGRLAFTKEAERGVQGYFVVGCNRPFADADNDHDVDQEDFAIFQICYTGSIPVNSPMLSDPTYCACFDRPEGGDIGDGDIDQTDLAEFEKCATGPAITFLPGDVTTWPGYGTAEACEGAGYQP